MAGDAMIKLMQGDCLDRMKEIEDGSVDLVLTDPPYGTTACKWDAVIPFAPMWVQVKRVLKPNGAAVFTASQPFTSALVMSNPKWFRDEWVWKKNAGTNFANAKRQPIREHEVVLVFSGGATVYNPIMKRRLNEKAAKCKEKPSHSGTTKGHHGFGTKRQLKQYDPHSRHPGTVLEINVVPNGGGKKQHPTQKPVALMEYMIRTYTNERETVLDFTMGSGTTGVACVKTNRNFIGIERDETYFNIAKDRINNAIEEEKWKLI